MFFIEFRHEFLESAGGLPFDVSEKIAGEIGADAVHVGLQVSTNEAGYGEFDVFA